MISFFGREITYTFFLGVITGFLLSIPIGPINLTVIRDALHGHFRRGFMIGLGGVLADTLYCTAAFLGFSTILSRAQFLWPYLEVGGGLVVLLIGIFYVLFPARSYTPAVQKMEDETAHFHRAFPLGFFLGISNPSLFVLWGTINTLFVANGWLRPGSAMVVACIAGIATGSTTWFTLISFWISRLHHQLSPGVISKVTRSCGILLIFFGCVLFGRLWIR